MKSFQLDVLRVHENHVVCNLYTESRCFRVFFHESEYSRLKRDGFFIRPNDEEDSAGVINTTEVYYTKSKSRKKSVT